jgi:CheY-like chemotaxis protein
MFSPSLRFLVAFAFVGALLIVLAPLHGQDKPDQAAIQKRKTLELLEKAKEEYRVFFKKPETAIEFWSAIKFEMDLGKFDLAGLHLKLLLEKPAKEVDADLVKLEQAEGMSAFLRLRQVRKTDWSDHEPFQKEALANVDILIDRVTKAVETHLSDPVRIRKFIAQLDAPTAEERGYAYVQLARSRERATPYLVEALRVNYGKPLFGRLRETMLRIGPESVPVYLEALKAQNDKDYRDLELRLTLLDLIQKRDDKRAVPYLWHLSAAKKYPEAVRRKAKEVLAGLLRVGVDDLQPARDSLTLLAEQYYQHKTPFPDGKPVKIWEWNGETISLTPLELTPYRAEEFFGLRYAREALDLDPGHQPAQIVLLSLILERTYRPKVPQILLEPQPPKLQQLLTTIDAELATRVLDRGLEDRQVSVVLPLIYALGERGEFRTARAGSGDQPRGIVRGLYYPDRRIQFAAMKAMLRMPPNTTTPVVADRIVDLSRRFLASEPNPKALVVYTPVGKEPAARQIAKDLGYEAVLARKTNEAIDKGKGSADFDLVILHRGMPDAEFPFVYGQIRKDADLGGLPMIVIVDKAREKAVQKFVAKDPGTVVITEANFQAGDDLKNLVEDFFKSAHVVKLTPAERKLFATISMDTLWRMARGEIQGYDVRPALGVIKAQTRSPDYGLAALEILGRLPGREIQSLLARIVGDQQEDLKVLRMPAVMELNRHMQTFGVQISKKQAEELKQAASEAAEGSPFRTQLNITASLISRSNAPQTGAELIRFRPDAPPPPKQKD